MINIILLALLVNTGNSTFLPQWMTPEESLRIDEIGDGFVPTNPPGGWVETPGEFEPLRGVFITWVYSQSSYRSIFREIVREVGEVCKCYIITSSSDTLTIKNYLTSGSVPLDSIIFYTWSYNSVWIRDYGPWFMRKQDNSEGIIDFIYNRPRPLDDTIPRCIGYNWNIPWYGSPLTHAGGNFMTDGLGTGFASTLINTENSQFNQRQIDSLMRAYSGLDHFVILPRINIEYTGHIDLWTKILNDTLIMVGSYAPGHSNYALLNANADSLSRCKNREGIHYRIVRIPMPWSTSDAPPTYLNSLFVNNKVLVPTWSLPEDDTGLAVYRHALPGYEIVGINCSAMSGSGGAIHCITMQIPSTKYIHIKHQILSNTNDTINSYRVRAQVITSSSMIPESCSVRYRVNNDTQYNSVLLSAVNDTPGVYVGYIPTHSIGDTVHYYLTMENSEQLHRNSPNHAPHHFYTFTITQNPSVEDKVIVPLISSFNIYPNPTRNRINFLLNVSQTGKIQVEIYNPLGQRIKTVFDGVLNSGTHNIQWNFINDKKQKFSYGTYFYIITTEDKTIVKKVLFVK
jgi:agmatine/peptidylarginine deiminase